MKKIKIICFIFILLFVSINIFATEHYVINTSSVISNKTFESYLDTDGGVFKILDTGELSLINVLFSSNSARDGGAIYNCGKVNIDSKYYLMKFENNEANSYGQGGGAIYNADTGILKIEGSIVFNSNSTNNAGGAVIGKGVVTIENNVVFSSNSAKFGGAIYCKGTFTIKDGAFFAYNVAKSLGGAILIEGGGILNLIANTNNVEFTGNTANGISNAIHINKGTINLWASENADIIFNDRISQDNTSIYETFTSIININQSSGTLPTIGKIILNEDMSYYIGIVNLYNGEIELIEGNKFFNTNNFTIYGGTLTANASNILNDFINNGFVNFIGGTNNNKITGTGTTIIDGTITNNNSITNLVTINQSKQLTTSATNINGNIENKGNLIFNNGANNNQIIGTGKTIIDGTVTNNNSITNLVTINQNKQLTTLATNIKKSIENNGNLIFNGGTNNNLITGIGLTQIYNNVINQANITQNKLEISANKQLTNSTATITVNELLTINNNAKIINDGRLLIKNGTNNGVIEQTKKTSVITIKGHFINNGTIEQNKLNIEQTGKLTTNINGVEITNSLISNNGILEINNIGENTNQITGTGKTIIDGIVTNNNSITNFVTINQNKQLTTSAINISGNIENNGNLVFNGGTNNNQITGIGTTIIDGNITNYSSITNLVTINPNKLLTTSATNIKKSIQNNGNLIFDNGTNSNQITGTGKTIIDGTVTNNSSITNSVTINPNKQLTTSATNIYGNIGNDGNLIFNGGTNNNLITGIGLTQIYNNVTNQANITQNKLEILANKQLTNSTATITVNELLTINSNAKIINDGKLTIMGGTNNGKIEQTKNTSVITINGNFTNNGTIQQKEFVIKGTGVLTNTGQLVQNIVTVESNGKIINNNTITATEIKNNGTIESNGIYDGYFLVSTNGNGGNDGFIATKILNNGKLINNNNVTASEIENNGNIESNATNINGFIRNNGNLTFTGGTNNNNITGTGVTIIGGTVINNSLITNSVTINQIKQLTTSATNISGNINNNGTLIFNSGIENNNRITGSGKLNITVNNFTNNNIVNQKTIQINPSVNNVNMVIAFDNDWQPQQNIFTNNSEISAETMELTATVLKLTEKGVVKVDNLSARQNSAMDLANNKIQQHNFKTISVTDNLSLSVDVDLANKQMDTIYSDVLYYGNINVSNINILSYSKENKTEIIFTTSNVLMGNITTSINSINSKYFKYDVEYNRNLGTFSFLLSAKSNPTKIESQVAVVAGGFITQVTVINQAFSSIDNIRNRILQVKKESPLYASTANTIFFQKTNRIESGLWLRPFTTQDSISLSNLSVDNTLTGTLAGLDLATGEDSLLSIYLGYAGSKQKYENIKINQTGYVLGLTEMFVKEKWYAGLTGNVIFNKASAESEEGTDDFDMNMYSVGAKAGYNFNLSESFILEPNLMLMYGNVNSAEYKTTQGATVEGQSNANIIFEPQIKAKLGLTNGWQPYGLLGYVMNCGDKVKAVVEGIEFEEQKIENYVEFGVGVDKSFKNSPWSLFLQLTGKSGDRSGFDGNLGIKYSFLTAKEKKKISKIKKIQAKRKAREEFLREKKKAELKEQQEIEEENKRIQQEEQEEQRILEIQRRIKANYEE